VSGIRTHRCPCGCGATVPDRYFACRDGWFTLPPRVRTAVWGTRHLAFSDTRRQAALAQAVAVYGDAAPPEWQALLPPEG